MILFYSDISWLYRKFYFIALFSFSAYQNNDIAEFEKILKHNRLVAIFDSAFTTLDFWVPRIFGSFTTNRKEASVYTARGHSLDIRTK